MVIGIREKKKKEEKTFSVVVSWDDEFDIKSQNDEIVLKTFKKEKEAKIFWEGVKASQNVFCEFDLGVFHASSQCIDENQYKKSAFYKAGYDVMTSKSLIRSDLPLSNSIN